MKKILVIEDSHSLRKDILEMLGFEGFETIGAENGLLGVEHAREYLPDLIICDIMMPGMDGYGVLESLQKDPVTALIPFIFLTARTDRMDVRQGMELGADDFLTKPFHAAELLATVRTRIEKRKTFSQISDQRLEDLRENIMMALPHELRTPLNVILGFSDLLMTDSEEMSGEHVGEMARHINSSALRLYRLIENFLIYSHTEIMLSDPRQVEFIKRSFVVAPRSTIEHCVVQKAEQCGRDRDVEMDIEETASIAIGEDYLRKIIDELMDNACKFSPDGTPIQVTGTQKGDYYELAITDHGRGMAPDEIGNVGGYMQFQRRVFEQQGAGLGLVICKRLAELHDGEFRIESVPDEKTTVTVKIPLIVK